ncbi:hypothetical protein [Rhodococcus sp. LW-XY12]|uniref:hypothetical protein n=1 Tax=Rhodococcus sp. LW-XY12 TaxID=2856851 RepID=UPI001C55B851|nr:hypothetical protein [Rhodococcus sp. LW-XY12]QXU56580.1 hypothetical protein KXC42_26005 [Rhodococcus sp. LW-XY12]
MSTIRAFEARTVASAVLQPELLRQIREAQQAVFSPAFREVQDAVHRDLIQPTRETVGAVLQARDTLVRAVSPHRIAFDRVLKLRSQVGEWLAKLNPIQQPASISGLDEHLVGLRRRSIDADLAAHVQLRALLARRSQQGPPPGRFVTMQPQVTRGPSTRKSINPYRLAGLVRV